MPVIAYNGKRPQVPASAFVAETATLVGDVRLGEGVSIWFGAVVRGDAATVEIGADTNVRDGAVIHADPDEPVRIGDAATIGHNATVNSATIGDGALVGIGSAVLNRAVVGPEAVIGAGAVIAPDTYVEPRTMWTGVPAHRQRTLEDHEVERVVRADNRMYRERRDAFLAQDPHDVVDPA